MTDILECAVEIESYEEGTQVIKRLPQPERKEQEQWIRLAYAPKISQES
jgi:hypothetical protein